MFVIGHKQERDLFFADSHRVVKNGMDFKKILVLFNFILSQYKNAVALKRNDIIGIEWY